MGGPPELLPTLDDELSINSRPESLTTLVDAMTLVDVEEADGLVRARSLTMRVRAAHSSPRPPRPLLQPITPPPPPHDPLPAERIERAGRPQPSLSPRGITRRVSQKSLPQVRGSGWFPSRRGEMGD